MATLEELEARVITLESQIVIARDRILALEDDMDTAKTKIAEIIRRLKAIIKRIKPLLIDPADQFDPYKAEAEQQKIVDYWVNVASNETDEL